MITVTDGKRTLIIDDPLSPEERLIFTPQEFDKFCERLYKGFHEIPDKTN